MKRLLAIALLLAALGSPAQGQSSSAAPEQTRVLLIVDCSQSMWEKWQSDAKIKVTQRVLLGLLDSIGTREDLQVALRVYGHLNKEAYGTQLEVPFEKDNTYKLRSKIKTLVPNGGCAAASALGNALDDFPNDGARNIVVIITDGMDDCEGSICEVAQRVHQSGRVVQTFILGIGSSNGFKSLPDCVGQFTFVQSEEHFFETLYEVFCLSDQKARVVLSVVDHEGVWFETEIPVVFYDHLTHAVRYANIYHYDSANPLDTFLIDPLATYDIKFFTKPATEVRNRKFRAGKDNMVEVAAPMGSLRLHQDIKRATMQADNYTVLVRQHDSTRLLATQPLGARVEYVAGRYDIDVLSLPPVHLINVAIRGGSATDLQIALPGQLALSKPKVATNGSIFVYGEAGLQWVCDLDASTTTERLSLMPGDYQVTLKPSEAATYTATRTARFSIVSAKQTSVDLERERRR